MHVEQREEGQHGEVRGAQEGVRGVGEEGGAEEDGEGVEERGGEEG
jgi:hypothetical protein